MQTMENLHELSHIRVKCIPLKSVSRLLEFVHSLAYPRQTLFFPTQSGSPMNTIERKHAIALLNWVVLYP